MAIAVLEGSQLIVMSGKVARLASVNSLPPKTSSKVVFPREWHIRIGKEASLSCIPQWVAATGLNE
jgi:hypothetical protein